MKSLVVYYLRTKTTKILAEVIADRVNADVEEIIPKVKYQGKIGYARGGKDAMREKIIDLESLKFDPSEYDVVYVGGPVWASRIANPVISYLKQNEGKFNNVKFFATAKTSGFDSAFSQMEKFSIKPLNTLGLKTKEVRKSEYDIDSFIN